MNPFHSRWTLHCAQGVTLAAALATAPWWRTPKPLPKNKPWLRWSKNCGSPWWTLTRPHSPA